MVEGSAYGELLERLSADDPGVEFGPVGPFRSEKSIHEGAAEAVMIVESRVVQAVVGRWMTDPRAASLLDGGGKEIDVRVADDISGDLVDRMIGEKADEADRRGHAEQ